MASETLQVIEQSNDENVVKVVNLDYQSRWRSPVLWLSLGGQIISILLMLGILNEAVGQQVSQVVAAVIQMLVIIGVLNDPTNKANW